MQANNNDFVCVRQACVETFPEVFFGLPIGFLAATSRFMSDAVKKRIHPRRVPMPWSMHSLRTRESLIPSSAAASWTVRVDCVFMAEYLHEQVSIVNREFSESFRHADHRGRRVITGGTAAAAGVIENDSDRSGRAAGRGGERVIGYPMAARAASRISFAVELSRMSPFSIYSSIDLHASNRLRCWPMAIDFANA